MKEKRVNLYIDGYNFYYSIKNVADNSKEYRGVIDGKMHAGHAWCNFKKLAEERLLQDDEKLEKIVYYTAKVEQENKEYKKEEKNQQLWLDYLKEYIPNNLLTIKMGYHRKYRKPPKKEKTEEILEELKNMIDKVFRGTNPKILEKDFRRLFNKISPSRKEKMTDVNMAVEMVIDGLCHENMDVAILITEDADFLSAVKALCEKPKELNTKPIDVRVYIPIPKKKNQWDKLELMRLTASNLTADWLARSVLPYKKKDSKEPSCRKKNNLPKPILKDIYEDKRNRFWTYDAIKARKKKVLEFPVVGDIVCNIDTDELEKTDAPDWKETPVYDYQEGKWIVYGEIEK